MRRPAVIWRLEGGYSRFLEGSHVEVNFADKGLSQSLDLSPLGLARRTEPVEIAFRFSRNYRGTLGGIRWTVGPSLGCKARLFFSGQSFLGNFKVPAGHFGVQWDVEARAEAGLEGQPGPFLVELDAGSLLHQSWVQLFPESASIGNSIRQAWEQYRNPLDPSDVFHLNEGEVVRWRWTGEVTLGATINWGVGGGWVIPSKIPLVELRKQILAIAGAGASFTVKQQGEFSLQVRKVAGSISLRVRREKRKEAAYSISLGVQLQNPLHVSRLGFSKPEALQTISRAVSQPLVSQLNRAFEEALTRRLQVALSVDRKSWKDDGTLFTGTWKRPSFEDLASSYCRLLRGDIPEADGKKLRVSGRLERVRGRQFTVSFHLLDWLKLGSMRTRESKTVASLGPAGEVVVEQTDQSGRTDYRWDQVQLTSMLYSQGTGGPSSVVWTWGAEGKFSREEMRRWLIIPLRLGILSEFDLPARAAFPLTARLITVTQFSEEGIRQVREASFEQRWQALVKALRICEPERYGRPTFWRDWIESEELRALVDREPIGSELLTRYPVPGRSDPERTMVVMTYRRVKKFVHLMELWKRGDREHLLRAVELDMQIPVIAYFHLLCEPALRRSAAVLTGGIERAWGDRELLTS